MSTITLSEQTTPATPAAGSVAVYAKTKALLFAKDDTGYERPISVSSMTSSLGADVSLSSVAQFFTGPQVAQGTSGTWFVSGQVTVVDTGASAVFDAKLWDGSTVIAALETNTFAATGLTTMSLSGIIVSPVANLRISVKDKTSGGGFIRWNNTGTSTDAVITAIRIG